MNALGRFFDRIACGICSSNGVVDEQNIEQPYSYFQIEGQSASNNSGKELKNPDLLTRLDCIVPKAYGITSSSKPQEFSKCIRENDGYFLKLELKTDNGIFPSSDEQEYNPAVYLDETTLTQINQIKEKFGESTCNEVLRVRHPANLLKTPKDSESTFADIYINSLKDFYERIGITEDKIPDSVLVNGKLRPEIADKIENLLSNNNFQT